MKIALVHDYIKEYGGAERVLEALHELYPKAPVFTTVYLPSFLGPHRERFKDWDIRTSWLQYIPFKHKLISPFRLLSPLAFRSFDFSAFDVVIVSATGAYFPNSIKTATSNPLTSLRTSQQKANSIKQTSYSPLAIRHKPVHICYCHTPPRYLYGYATAREWKKNVIFKILGEVANHFLRMVDYNASKNVDYYIANSEEVAGRIRKFYRREATVIYPPVDVAKSKGQSAESKREYFLAGGRLARPKHVDLIVDVCLKLKLPLKVFGKSFAGYGEELESRIKNHESRVEFVGEVTDEEKWELMRNAKAFIFASEDEDFGITPVEAMVYGTPVIAYRSGGVKETVIDNETGLFFDELTIESLSNAIKKFQTIKFDSKIYQKKAEKFSKERFVREIERFIEKLTST